MRLRTKPGASRKRQNRSTHWHLKALQWEHARACVVGRLHVGTSAGASERLARNAARGFCSRSGGIDCWLRLLLQLLLPALLCDHVEEIMSTQNGGDDVRGSEMQKEKHGTHPQKLRQHRSPSSAPG